MIWLEKLNDRRIFYYLEQTKFRDAFCLAERVSVADTVVNQRNLSQSHKWFFQSLSSNITFAFLYSQFLRKYYKR